MPLRTLRGTPSPLDTPEVPEKLPGISPSRLHGRRGRAAAARAVEKKSGKAGLFQGIESAYCGTPLPALARTAEKRHTIWCAFLYALVYVLLISQMIIPSQWSISCWIICAVQPVKVFSLVWNFSFWYCTLMDCQRRVLRVPVSDRQPSSAS